MKNSKISESRSRAYTKKELFALGWNIKHPLKGGQVLEEQEAKNYDERFDELLDNKRPDFLIYHGNEPIIVIENKNEKTKLNEAVEQAKEYADKLSKKYFKVNVISAVAGDDENGVVVRTYYRIKNSWILVKANDYPLTQLLTNDQFDQLIRNNDGTLDLKIPTQGEFYRIAEKINDTFEEAKVNKNDRAIYLGTIILAMKMGEISANPNLILTQINSYVDIALKSYNKAELIPLFKIKGNSTKLKHKLPIVFHNLDRLNIRALMNTGDDVLGKFFEAFLRYGNDAKELGIVFTPRHITKFICDIVKLQPNDIVYDPACGTGGFLVTAFSIMKNMLEPNKKAIEHLKINQIIGTDSDDSGKIPALAVVNMIFRGDGKSNIFNENCFEFQKFGKQFATKVLMNPPYAQKDESENMFIEHAIESCSVGGTVAVITTYADFCQKSNVGWRNWLIENNTVEAVFTMPQTLFYPTNQPTIIAIIKAHIPHNNKKILFCRINNDGYRIKRSKRIEMPGEQLSEALAVFQSKDIGKSNVNRDGFSIYTKLLQNDPLTEIVPEMYLISPKYDSLEVNYLAKQLLREYLSFTIKYHPQLSIIPKNTFPNKVTKRQYFGKKILGQIFEIYYGERTLHSKEHLEDGQQIIISSKGVDNGLYGFYDLKPLHTEVCISIPNTGSIGLSYVQEFNCSIDDNCLIIKPLQGIKITIEELYYISAYFRMDIWRYRYGRQITETRIENMEIDFELMDFDNLSKLRMEIEKIQDSFKG
jgi:type I restriction-modification system DNA methylase subunit